MSRTRWARPLTVAFVTLSAVLGGAATAAAAAEPAAAPAIIERTEWIPDPNGRRLAVYPTGYGRYTASSAERMAAWNEVVRLTPEADRRNMLHQFLCHYDFVRIAEPAKPSWNLEQWRPDVGYLATVAARCNPA